jgi:uncharacterized NAD(P)/FAD-binding protein YdhS/predicted metal-dependent enzyme (double-stranded beta helix superfamily)
MPPVVAQAHLGLDWLVRQLDTCAVPFDEDSIRHILREARLTVEEVAPYIEPRAASYARRCVVRRDRYELLVLTWLSGQGSVAHDHSGCLCALKVVQGRLTEQLYQLGCDGQVRKTTASHLGEGGEGEITVDPGVVIHALKNEADSGQTLVTVHVYSPPLPEVRRYAVTDQPPAKVFSLRPTGDARTIAIIGGGFTGTMTLANLLRFGGELKSPLHIVLVDRQPAIGEGVAYRTNDVRHLLNVPAAKMSAWPDGPDDFLAFARQLDPSVNPGDFLPRRIYGQYVRRTLLELANKASDLLTVEVLKDDATRLTPSDSSSWNIQTASGRSIHADLAVLTLGHRPPDDPFGKRWHGPRNRFVADPWAALVLSQIGPDEPVLLLGSGLTAVDAILTLNHKDRTAPITVVSRRGLMPLPHSTQPQPPADLSALLKDSLDPARPLTVRRLFSSIRKTIAQTQAAGIDWRQVIDGLRPAISQLWGRLDSIQRARFLRHLRPLWEIHRHRMAPTVAETIDGLRQRKILDITAGSVISATADAEGVNVTLSRRGQPANRTLRVSWVINCTGPGAHNRHSTHAILRPLLESGVLSHDEFDLGLLTDSDGRAMDAAGNVLSTLLVAGTLRKSTLWESTAVPELRQQAYTVAKTALASLAARF